MLGTELQCCYKVSVCFQMDTDFGEKLSVSAVNNFNRMVLDMYLDEV